MTSNQFLGLIVPPLLVGLSGLIMLLITRRRDRRTPEEIDRLIAELEREKAAHRKA